MSNRREIVAGLFVERDGTTETVRTRWPLINRPLYTVVHTLSLALAAMTCMAAKGIQADAFGSLIIGATVLGLTVPALLYLVPAVLPRFSAITLTPTTLVVRRFWPWPRTLSILRDEIDCMLSSPKIDLNLLLWKTHRGGEYRAALLRPSSEAHNAAVVVVELTDGSYTAITNPLPNEQAAALVGFLERGLKARRRARPARLSNGESARTRQPVGTSAISDD
jgi:hypothetical protein